MENNIIYLIFCVNWW